MGCAGMTGGATVAGGDAGAKAMLRVVKTGTFLGAESLCRAMRAGGVCSSKAWVSSTPAASTASVRQGGPARGALCCGPVNEVQTVDGICAQASLNFRVRGAVARGAGWLKMAMVCME